jgi:AmmeMemoRadiSam system protein A
VVSSALVWLDDSLGAWLVRLARSVVAESLGRERDSDAHEFRATPKSAGAFVTLTLRDSLRGCMGYMRTNLSLYETIKYAALAAAFNDPRFPPLTGEELDECVFEVTVLGEFTQLSEDELAEPSKVLTIGLHGLMAQRGSRSGVLLPQVALEENWGPEEFLCQTCMKAGLPPDSWRHASARVYKFEAKWFKEGLR